MNLRTLWWELGLLLVALGAGAGLSACAPAGAFTPLIPASLSSDDREAGFAGVSNIDARDISSPEETAFNGQFWYDMRIAEETDAGFIVFAGQTSFVGAGGRLRKTVMRSGRFALALEGQGGITWVAGAVPMSMRLTDGIYLYSAPSAGARRYSPIQIPVGLALATSNDYSFMIESGVGLDPGFFEEERLTVFPTLGLALAWKF